MTNSIEVSVSPVIGDFYNIWISHLESTQSHDNMSTVT